MYHYHSHNSNSNNSSIISSNLPRNTTHLPLHPALLVKPVEQGIVGLLVILADLTYPQDMINYIVHSDLWSVTGVANRAIPSVSAPILAAEGVINKIQVVSQAGCPVDRLTDWSMY